MTCQVPSTAKGKLSGTALQALDDPMVIFKTAIKEMSSCHGHSISGMMGRSAYKESTGESSHHQSPSSSHSFILIFQCLFNVKQTKSL
jgi:hypothetical protein